jgi:hypothetical protein
VNKKTKEETEEEFRRLSKELDSPEGQAETEAQAQRELRKASDEHARFLTRSRARGFRRVVRARAPMPTSPDDISIDCYLDILEAIPQAGKAT